MVNSNGAVPQHGDVRLIEKLRKYASANGRRSDPAFVPASLATELTSGRDTFALEGGEAIWMKKDSDTVFYLTLESYSVQLTVTRLKDGSFGVMRRALGGNARKRPRRYDLSVRDAFNQAAISHRTPSS